MAANFFILDAADVALTEAAVGAGVTTIIFLSALALTAEKERSRQSGRFLSLAVVAVSVLVLIYATFDKPRLGDPQAPVHQHVAPWYLDKTPELIDIPNVVTAVLASFRGYDTLGEVFRSIRRMHRRIVCLKCWCQQRSARKESRKLRAPTSFNSANCR